MHKLLISPYYFRNEGSPDERLGRSFFREDLGYGDMEGPVRGLAMFGSIRLSDLQGLEMVKLQATIPPAGLIEDEQALQVMENALEFALRAFPGAPPSIYQKG